MSDVFTRTKRGSEGRRLKAKMADVFSKSKRSEVMSRIRSRGSESLEVEVVAADAEVFDDVGDDAAGHIARMPRERDEPAGTKGV